MNFELIFMGDSYTQGWGLWYHYWCKNKLYNQLDLYEKYLDVHAAHSGFIDNEALNFAWSNRFPALVASHFNTIYRTNCWEDVGHFSSYTGFPMSRERVHTAATKLIESYLEYFKKYDNKVRKFFILQTSEVKRDTILGFDYQVEATNIINNIINELSNSESMLSTQKSRDELMETAVMELLINSDELDLHGIEIELFGIKRVADLFKGENFEKILYKLWETLWSKMQIELKKYNCELLILHAQAQFHRNVSIPKTIKIPPGGYINQNLHKFTVEKEIYDKYNIVIKESHPGLQLHQKIADSIVKHIEDNLI